MLRVAGVLRRHGSSLIDQVLSGGTNFIMIAVVAQRMTAESFGVFAIAYAALQVFLVCTRTYLGIPIALSAKASGGERASLYNGAITIVLLTVPLVGVVIGAVIPLIILATTGQHFWMMCAIVAVATCLVMAQDLSRYAAIASGRARVAIASDAAWLLGVLALIPVGGLLDDTAFLTAWCAVIAVSLVIAAVRLRPVLDWPSAVGLLRPRAGARESATVAGLINSSTTLIVALIVGSFLLPEDAGSLRGAGTMLGPINLLLAVLDLSVLGSIARLPRHARLRNEAGIAGALIALTGLWAGVLFVLPDAWGTLLLGPTWHGAHAILMITALEYAIANVSAVGSLELKVRNSAHAQYVAKAIQCAITIGGCLVLGMVGAPFLAYPWLLVGTALIGATIVAVRATSVGFKGR